MDSRRAGVRVQLHKWREDLIDLTKRNRLLYFKHLRSGSLGFSQDPTTLLEGLNRRGSKAGWGFYLPADGSDQPRLLGSPDAMPPRDDELLVVAPEGKDTQQIKRSLRTLDRKARAEQLDTGLWVLYLGLGALRWRDGDDHVTSPLYLRPVRLERPRGSDAWRLRAHDDAEPALNPSLAVKLDRDFGITLPSLDQLEDDSYSTAITAVQRAVQPRAWRVEETAILCTFTFQKEVIYKDLQANEDAIVSHSLVRLLAEGPTSTEREALDFTPVREDQLDVQHPPEDLMCIMDADGSQRQCLVAARQGRSFVMDGPPGTGKSQTIANVIAQLLHDHKTVLFVSEKAAALEVVRNRLAKARLDPFILELHSLKATRKAVAQALGEALENSPAARSRFTDEQRARLQRERKRLTDYALAVNEVRRPSQLSFHDVVGEISRLRGHPEIPVPDLDATSLDPAAIEGVNDHARQLSRAWAPVEQGDDFLWRDLAETPVSSEIETHCVGRVRRLRTAMQDLKDAGEAVHDNLWIAGRPTPATTGWLQQLLELVENRPPIAEEWLTTPNAEQARDLVTRLANEAGRLFEKERDLAAATAKWSSLDPFAAYRLQQIQESLAETDPRPGTINDLSSKGLSEIRDGLQDTVKTIDAVEQVASPLKQAFGVGADISPMALDRLVRLAKLADQDTRPEPQWFEDGKLEAAKHAHRELAEIVPKLNARHDDLMRVFKPSALDLELEALRERFTHLHRGIRKLRPAYRADKRVLAAHSPTGRFTKEMLIRLGELVAHQEEDRSLNEVEARHDGILGAYYQDRNADLELCRDALSTADQALAIAGDSIGRQALASALGTTQGLGHLVASAARQAAESLADFRGSELAAWLGPTMLSLESTDWGRIAEWCRGLAAVIDAITDEVAAVETTIGRPIRFAAACDLSGARADQAQLAAAVTELADSARYLIGELADAPRTDALRAASDWVDRIRGHLDGEIEPSTANSILASDLSASRLAEPRTRVHQQTELLLGTFQKPYRAALQEELHRSYDSAFELLDALTDSASDMHIWSEHVEARNALAVAGLKPALDECRKRRLPAEDVPGVVRLALLKRWADQIADSDSRLRPKFGAGRDDYREAFQVLDRKLVENTAAAVINKCAERRPRSMAGGAALIKQQAQLKKRHKPVRTLLGEAGWAAQRLKPCFMMSPLSVSQFLPPDMRFDAVVFDEASQVKEADAVGCMYRGAQLIVAGDQRQLPPTSFFDRMADTDDEELDDLLLDFESVLDRCKANGLVGLPLNWHYRSRHESLITYSNRSFYGGRLHTFPGAVFDSEDLGVEFCPVEGVYRRGTTRDNPEEATEVVDRVLFHRRHHPELTLGVVTLSTAQQSAVETEIERRSRDEPELRELVTDDRLSGFFVKNLETVQGDERDIIILTIGYGPDEHGKLHMNFGPLNKQGGERRLNVAVTRARRRVEVVASISGGDIVSDRDAVSHLRRYLDYAEHGSEALAVNLEDSQGEPESPFEEEVLESIRSMGYQAVPQVGAAGYRIDIGIRHPDKPGRYVLGVECDGASYHSSKVARDRDRLRQQILEGLGWTIHRIWSTAWFQDRSDEEQRIRESITRAINAHAPAATSQPTAEPEIEFVEVNYDAMPDWARDYLEPEVPGELAGPGHWAFHEPESRSRITRQAESIVSEHGPIHREGVLHAVRSAWNLRRAGARMRESFDRAVAALVREGRVERDGDWLLVPGQETEVRVPVGSTAARREVSEVPPSERERAIFLLLRDAGPSRPSDLRQAWARLYGWARVGPDIEMAFKKAVEALRTAKVVEGHQTLRALDPNREGTTSA